MRVDPKILLIDNDTYIDRTIRTGFMQQVTEQCLPWHVTICNEGAGKTYFRQLSKSIGQFDIAVGLNPNDEKLHSLLGGSPLLVASCSQSPLRDKTVVHVHIDNDALAETAVQHFVRQKIRYLGSVQMHQPGPVQQRQQAFSTACTRHGLQHVAYQPGQHSDPDPESHLTDWLNSHSEPIGILCHDDRSASWLTGLCAVHDIQVPSTVAILGVNNNVSRCEANEPPLSSVIVPWRQAGKALAEGLNAFWNGGRRPQHKTCRPMAVLTRESSSLLTHTSTDRLMVRAATLLIPKKRSMLSIAEVAKRIGLGAKHFTDRFRQTYACSPKEWQQRKRIELAQSQLLLTDNSVAGIAQELHFRDYRHFSTTFKQHTGMSPKHFRDKPVS